MGGTDLLLFYQLPLVVVLLFPAIFLLVFSFSHFRGSTPSQITEISWSQCSPTLCGVLYATIGKAPWCVPLEWTSGFLKFSSGSRLLFLFLIEINCGSACDFSVSLSNFCFRCSLFWNSPICSGPKQSPVVVPFFGFSREAVPPPHPPCFFVCFPALFALFCSIFLLLTPEELFPLPHSAPPWLVLSFLSRLFFFSFSFAWHLRQSSLLVTFCRLTMVLFFFVIHHARKHRAPPHFQRSLFLCRFSPFPPLAGAVTGLFVFSPFQKPLPFHF